MTKRTEKFLTDRAQIVANKLAPSSTFKLVISAGVICLAEQTAEKREFYLAYASGANAPELHAQARQKELDKIHKQLLLNPSAFSPADKRKIEDLFKFLERIYVEEMAEFGREMRKKT